eukprot:gene7325-7904_t
MGQKHSLEDDLITFRLTSKQMARSAKKCDKNMAQQTEKLKKAIKDGNMEGAKIYAQNVIREKNQSLNFLRLGSRIDAVASRLETAIRMQDVNKAMAQTVKGMSNAMKSMEVEQIAKTMEEFERQFENMDVRSGYMESTMEATTAMSTPPEQVDQLIQMVAAEAGLSISDQLAEPGKAKVSEQKVAAPEDELESRLAALRR